MSWKINPEWLALEDKPHFVLAISQPDAFREIKIGPQPKEYRMRIVIEIIPHKDQRYPSVGDWQFDEQGNLSIRVSHSQHKYDACLIMHELAEALLCGFTG